MAAAVASSAAALAISRAWAMLDGLNKRLSSAGWVARSEKPARLNEAASSAIGADGSASARSVSDAMT
jgi:hypothetical protein